MFAHAESFNQPLNNWGRVSQVASLGPMFYYAYAADQDLAAGADASVAVQQRNACRHLRVLFCHSVAMRASTFGCPAARRCAPTPAPTPIDQTSAAGAVAARYWTLAGALAGAACALSGAPLDCGTAKYPSVPGEERSTCSF